MHPNPASSAFHAHPTHSTHALPEWFSQLAAHLQSSALPAAQARWRLCWIEKFLIFARRHPLDRSADWPAEFARDMLPPLAVTAPENRVPGKHTWFT